MARNLVIVRAGDESLHPAWLGNPGERNWDLIVNYFGDKPDLYRGEGIVRIDSKGPKWPALHETISGLGDRLDEYDYIWLPDDDLACDVQTVNKFFEICAALKLELAQPALTLDSYVSYHFTIRNKFFQVRFNNFVEIMAPCFSRDFLKRCLPSFAANMSGWGLDFLWPTWIEDPAKIAVVDAAAVRHTRPFGGPNYNALKERGVTAQEELDALLEKEGVKFLKPMTRGGIDIQGNVHATWNGGHKGLIQALMYGYLPEFGQHPPALFGIIDPILDDLAKTAAAMALRGAGKQA